MKSVVEVYSGIAKSNPPWTAQEELDFIRSCTNDNGQWLSDSAKDRFVNEAMKHNLGLVFKMVSKLAFNKTEDVVQKAIIGMVDALKKYDPGHRGKISTWITNPIRWAIMQHQNAYAKSGTVAEEIAALNHKHRLSMSVVSIDAAIDDDGEDSGDKVSNLITNDRLDVDYVVGQNIKGYHESIYNRDMEIAVGEMMKTLPNLLNEREIYVVNEVFKGKTQTDISGELHLSKVRISQIQASAFEKIRSSPMAKHLRKLLK